MASPSGSSPSSKSGSKAGSKTGSKAASPRSTSQPMDESTSSPVSQVQLAEERKAAGTAKYTAGDFSQAVILYSEAIDLLPPSISPSIKASYLNNRAAAQLMLKNYDQAINDANQAITTDPTFMKAYQRAIKCYMLTGAFSQAKSLIERSPAPASLKSELAEITKYETMQKRAETLLQTNQSISFAISLLKQLIEACPGNVNAQLLLVNALIQAKKLDEAKSLVDTLYRANPSNVSVIFLRGRVLYLSGSSDMALRHCQ